MEKQWTESPLEVVWEGDMRYRGGEPGGASLMVDGSREAAPSPVQAMLVSLAACSAIDVVEILNKRRTPPASVSVGVQFSRREAAPRRITAAHLTFRIATGSERHHVERAVELSFEKYCSVSSSFAPDTELSWEVELLPLAQEAAAGD